MLCISQLKISIHVLQKPGLLAQQCLFFKVARGALVKMQRIGNSYALWKQLQGFLRHNLLIYLALYIFQIETVLDQALWASVVHV